LDIAAGPVTINTSVLVKKATTHKTIQAAAGELNSLPRPAFRIAKIGTHMPATKIIVE
jgi:hypothetical protein